MDNKKVKGYAYGVIASVSYGLNPLFALPLYASGIRVDSVLFYRYVFALLFLAVMMKMSGQSFALKRNEILPVAVMGLLFSFSSLSCSRVSTTWMQASLLPFCSCIPCWWR